MLCITICKIGVDLKVINCIVAGTQGIQKKELDHKSVCQDSGELNDGLCDH